MEQNYIPAKVPIVGGVLSTIISLVTISVLSICLTRRIQNIIKWKRLPLIIWLVIIIYIDSMFFVFITAILSRGIGINSSLQICEGAIFLCLVCYMSTKLLIYCFLVEKAYIIRGSRFPRLKTRLWLFNSFGLLVPYTVVMMMNFVFRIAYIDEQGVCIIGMKKIAMLPFITLDVVVNVYLTLLFIIPLRQLYTYQHNTNTALHTMAFRSFIGTLTTLASSVVNLSVLMVLKGEPGWICLMCCNADILFSVFILHWVTEVDSVNGSGSSSLHQQNTDMDRSKPDDNNNNNNTTPITPRPINCHIPDGQATPSADPVWSGPKGRKPSDSTNLVGTITTECRSVSFGGRGNSPDQTVELKSIRVQTEHTHQVEIDGRSESEIGETNITSAEKMV
ncbi:hypothetical protein K504DRAFT_531002 [Pleomassaria siparia CBS 279.74]|uniref:G-protein coupled receptors family 1 profile domain-containing protein n=1 Tax=Pleomassaria siparia CBS 279.74 TaxID=1314801 RepID=A0A6G1KMT3_9PLEO|nr:hypothetical protein K504DRAFT_531002 [Pleomassaria siparia CBS 279.74]